MKAVLLIDFGSTYTKVTAIDIEKEMVLGTSKAHTTINDDICNGLNHALNSLETKIGKIEYKEKFACSSAAGGLKMIAVGLVPDLTAEAAKRAALSAGAKVMKVFSYELNKEEAREIEQLQPDIVLLTGGTDGGNHKVILHNAKILASLKSTFPVVVAGNKSVVEEVKDILIEGVKEVTVCANVMPELGKLNIEPTRAAIREIFLRRIVQAKGLTKVQELVKGILMPTPSAVLNAATLLSKGTKGEKGFGDIIVIDVGGATTDIHSIADGLPKKAGILLKGLPEPNAKRTVEGDLGVRYSAGALIETCGMDQLRSIINVSEEKINEYINLIKLDPSLLPDKDEDYREVDDGLVALAIRTAVQRHVGTIETHYTPYGATYVQIGKDLTSLKKIIGTGGPIINNKKTYSILKESLFREMEPTVLRPMQGEFYLDKKYILAAMGLLAEKYPETAIRIMKKEIQIIES